MLFSSELLADTFGGVMRPYFTVQPPLSIMHIGKLVGIVNCCCRFAIDDVCAGFDFVSFLGFGAFTTVDPALLLTGAAFLLILEDDGVAATTMVNLHEALD